MSDSVEEVSIVTLMGNPESRETQVRQDARTLAAAFRTHEILCEVGIPGTTHEKRPYVHIFFRASRPAPFEVTEVFNKTAPQFAHTASARFRKHTTEWVKLS